MRIQEKKRTSFSGLFLSTFFSTLPSHLSLHFLFNSSSRSVGLLSFFARALRLSYLRFFILAIVSLCFYGLCNFTDFPVFRVSREFKNSSRIELVQKYLGTVMSSSKLPLDCDELVRKFLRTLMKPSKFLRSSMRHRNLTVRYNQSLVSDWKSPVR